jgi:hypothetical protein
MKKSLIKIVLKKKIDDWIESIYDVSLKQKIKDDIIVTGGCIYSLLINEKVNDYDIYFKTKDTVLLVAQYYVDKFKQNPVGKFKNYGGNLQIDIKDENNRIKIYVKSAGIATVSASPDYQYFENPELPDTSAESYINGIVNPVESEEVVDETKEISEEIKDKKKSKYRPLMLTSNAITLSDQIQVVIRFFGPIDDIHKNFDFIHCTNYYDYKNNDLVLHPEALESIVTKQLNYVGSLYPLCSLIRLRKFIQRGWNVNAGQIVKISYQISELDLKDPKVLEEQLTGVDYAYFKQLIDVMKSDIKDKPQMNIDSTYICNLIDKIF